MKQISFQTHWSVFILYHRSRKRWLYSTTMVHSTCMNKSHIFMNENYSKSILSMQSLVCSKKYFLLAETTCTLVSVLLMDTEKNINLI